METNILIVGTGGIGGYFGGRLQEAGATVSTVSNSDFETVKQYGYDIKSIYGDFTFKPVEVVKKANDFSKKADYLIVALKVLPEIDTISLIKDAVSTETTIILIQNGINIEKHIYQQFPNNEIISAIAYIGVRKTDPGKIIHQDNGKLIIGKYPYGKSCIARKFADLFENTHIPCKVVENIQYYRWLKLVWNIPYNSVSVLGNHADTKSIMDNEYSLNLIKKLMQEVANCAEKDGYKLDDNVIQENLDFTSTLSPYKTSMLIDFENNRKMEIDAILGNTIELADKLNVNIPHIKTIYALLKLVNRNKVKLASDFSAK